VWRSLFDSARKGVIDVEPRIRETGVLSAGVGVFSPASLNAFPGRQHRA
jgi:hypothetical protein